MKPLELTHPRRGPCGGSRTQAGSTHAQGFFTAGLTKPFDAGSRDATASRLPRGWPRARRFRRVAEAMEARTGIEPMYEDLQFPPVQFPIILRTSKTLLFQPIASESCWQS